MSAKIAQRIATLAARRRRLAEDYRTARRRHRGAAKAHAALRSATHAQLEAEMRLARATPLLRAAREQRQAAPDLFSSTMGP
ncbi:hypothetical protein [Kaistia sp. MMO-174]|uniref:hypothetical protein n=1 Tax=Kaistia sp. MMO-174 TaxID=3081256 RepID=UPI001AD493ED|nr:hypothetical protein [Hyphomicrobiales bacterium]